MARVYLETSFISACVTRREDPASVYRRQASLEWWTRQSHRHDLFVSAEVLGELSHPSHQGAAEALTMIQRVPLVALTDEVIGLAAMLVREKVMPSPVGGDAVHVAAACVHALDFLVTWNVRHLANRNKMSHVLNICLRLGLTPPQILTPELLWDDEDDDEPSQ
jgi:hypothetical protein